MATSDEVLHTLARERAASLGDPDKKQLRFNEIVDTAKAFYRDAEAGVRELVDACDRAQADLYVKGRPMWRVLNSEYDWMRL